jgi:hypothetical protein
MRAGMQYAGDNIEPVQGLCQPHRTSIFGRDRRRCRQSNDEDEKQQSFDFHGGEIVPQSVWIFL